MRENSKKNTAMARGILDGIVDSIFELEKTADIENLQGNCSQEKTPDDDDEYNFMPKDPKFWEEYFR